MEKKQIRVTKKDAQDRLIVQPGARVVVLVQGSGTAAAGVTDASGNTVDLDHPAVANAAGIVRLTAPDETYTVRKTLPDGTVAEEDMTWIDNAELTQQAKDARDATLGAAAQVTVDAAQVAGDRVVVEAAKAAALSAGNIYASAADAYTDTGLAVNQQFGVRGNANYPKTYNVRKRTGASSSDSVGAYSEDVFPDEATGRSVMIANGALVGTQFSYLGTAGSDGTKPIVLAHLTSVSGPGASVVDSRSVPSGLVIATAGLATGGGDLSGNRTITVPKAGDAESDGGTDDATAMTPKQVRRQLDQRTKRSGNRNWITRWVGAEGKFAGGIRRSGALVALVGGTLTDIGARILSGEATAAAAASAADVKATAADAKIAARIPIRRSGDIWRVLDAAKTKIALRVTRTGRFLVLGRDILLELDALAGASRFSVVARRGASLLFRDSTGKAPFLITRTGRTRLLGRDVLAEIDRKADIGSIPVPTPSVDLLLAGDSQINGAGGQTPWRTQIVPLISARNISVRAVGGTRSNQIAVACGALYCVATIAGDQIPAGTAAVALTDIKLRSVSGTMSAFSPLNDQAPTTRSFSLLGIPGVLTRNSDATAYTWQRSTAASAIYCPPDSPLVATVGDDRKRTMVIGIGRNNITDVETIWRDILAFEALQPFADKRQIWLPPTPAATEIVGSTAWNSCVELESRMVQRWGDHVVNIRTRSWQYGNGSTEDNADIANKTIPRSLTVAGATGSGGDYLHYSTALHGYIAQWIADIINRNSW